jgi:carboxypeptidase C (cathepsin A)
MKVLLWAGDADWLCNWVGNLQVAEGVSFLQQGDFRARNFTPYMVNGTEKGSIKSVDNLTFLKVYAAGHDVPYWRKSEHGDPVAYWAGQADFSPFA